MIFSCMLLFVVAGILIETGAESNTDPYDKQ